MTQRYLKTKQKTNGPVITHHSHTTGQVDLQNDYFCHLFGTMRSSPYGTSNVCF